MLFYKLGDVPTYVAAWKITVLASCPLNTSQLGNTLAQFSDNSFLSFFLFSLFWGIYSQMTFCSEYCASCRSVKTLSSLKGQYCQDSLLLVNSAQLHVKVHKSWSWHRLFQWYTLSMWPNKLVVQILLILIYVPAKSCLLKCWCDLDFMQNLLEGY